VRCRQASVSATSAGNQVSAINVDAAINVGARASCLLPPEVGKPKTAGGRTCAKATVRGDQMRIYRYLPLLLAVLVAITVLSGCGGKGGGY
jgi:hypothetical protein